MTPAALARLNADLDEALELREEWQRLWGTARYTSSGSTTPERAHVELARVNATILELQERLAQAGAPAPASAEPVPVPSPTAPANDAPEYLSTKQAAVLLGMTPKALESLRCRGRGPAFVQIGRSIRYRREDLLNLVRHGSPRGSR